jgi:hypothetical protein
LLYKGIRRDKKLLIFHTTAGFLEIVPPPPQVRIVARKKVYKYHKQTLCVCQLTKHEDRENVEVVPVE